jgi:putative tryptophan/tyrosine transport system substrate-binding protein
MRRREFISVIGGAAAWPITARAQQIERPRRIGILLGSYSSTDQAGQVRIGTLLKTLRELGWEDGRNLSIDYRWGAGNTSKTSGSRQNWCSPRQMRSLPRVTRWSRSFIG